MIEPGQNPDTTRTEALFGYCWFEVFPYEGLAVVLISVGSENNGLTRVRDRREWGIRKERKRENVSHRRSLAMVIVQEPRELVEKCFDDDMVSEEFLTVELPVTPRHLSTGHTHG